MQLLRRKSDNAVFDAAESSVIGENGYTSENVKMAFANLIDYEIIPYEGSLPSGFLAGRFAFNGNAWSILDQAEYDEFYSSLLDRKKTEKRSQLREYSQKKQDAGFDFNGMLIETDTDARSMLLAGKVNNKTRKFVTKNGTRLQMTGAEFSALVDAVDDFIQNAMDTEFDKSAEIDAATTLEALDAVQVDGW